jgi:hypothetical protein
MHDPHLRAPEPTLEQVEAFLSYHNGKLGGQIDADEARLRLKHVAELFFLLGGAEWVVARHPELAEELEKKRRGAKGMAGRQPR